MSFDKLKFIFLFKLQLLNKINSLGNQNKFELFDKFKLITKLAGTSLTVSQNEVKISQLGFFISQDPMVDFLISKLNSRTMN